MGWAGLANGELLRRAAVEGFDVLITAGQHIEYQQNVPTVGVGIIVLVVANTYRIQDLLPLLPELLRVLPIMRPGQLTHVN